MSDTVKTGGAPVRLRGVSVRYPGADRDAVTSVDLDVPAGALVVLLGPSGCGKSTLLRTINRLVAPSAGRIEVDGAEVAAVDPQTLRRGIGYVIQAVGLFGHMTIAQNVAIVPQLLGWPPAQVAARDRARLPRELSGGEQQRAGVARALAARPRLLLMDEPFGAVDAIVRAALQEETLRIHRLLGTTILFVTHDVDEALRLADRIVVMKAGRIEQDDTPLRILAKPATPYVAELLDAHDAVRRLGLLRARDAMRAPEPGAAPPGARIDAGASLRAALSLLLEGAERLAVDDGGSIAGTLAFADIRAALAATER